MGRDLSYKVVKKGYKVPREEDFERETDYDTEYSKHLDGFSHLCYCRNGWDGPVSGFIEFMYSRQEIKTFLKNYLSSAESKNFEYTLKGCVEILLSISDDELVIIHYK